MPEKLIGVIGGSGLGDALAARLKDVVLEDMDTPFGKPSAPVMMGRLGSTKVAFLARHGIGQNAQNSTKDKKCNIINKLTV